VVIVLSVLFSQTRSCLFRFLGIRLGVQRGSFKTGFSHSCLFGESEDAMTAASSSRLARVLDGAEEVADEDTVMDVEAQTEDAPQGFCVDCKDQRARVRCEECGDEYCRVCFNMLHRKGKRSSHAPISLTPNDEASSDEREEMTSADQPVPSAVSSEPRVDAGNYFIERAKYIPIRLTLAERKKLRLVEAALSVSGYTDKVDTPGVKKAKRVHMQLQDICSFLSSLLIATDYTAGKELMDSREFKEHEEFFQTILEIGRRHKVMNPEKMRGEYGKLIYMLQDSSSQEVQQFLDISCVRPLKTVFSYLEERGAEGVLKDGLITVATREILADGVKSRNQLNRESMEKHRAIEHLAQKYSSKRIEAEEIQLCLYSIGDNHSFLTANRDPVNKMITYLTTLFNPDRIEEGYDLSIADGAGGARLSHSHAKQYQYVLQSLTLWKEIAHDMFRLWCLAEEDLLSPDNRYDLKDTGQGLQRVQAAPRVSKAMRNILHSTQQRVGSWIGSSVVHLGDNNVPNALIFIDKYTQVASILNPIVIVLRNIPELCKNPQIESYIRTTFGGPEKLQKDILLDFFRSAFDGSGADNFYDAGSCIDGRLTSAWHWCSNISEKPFYPIFKLAGFTSFDGEFQK